MAFETLSDKLQGALRGITRKGRLTEADIDVMLREVRLALLEADVNIKIIKEFIAEVKEQALGEKVMKSLTPSQQVVKIVNDELTNLMGRDAAEINFATAGPTVLMMVGLQGAGKTTQTGKLASFLRKNHKKKPLLIACDVYRPAAVDQLKTLGSQLGIPVFEKGVSESPVTIAKEAMAFASEQGHDLVIVDTAGRLHIDEGLMDELAQVKAAINPQEILLVVDAMTGQDAVNVAGAFHEQMALTGVILTKLDGDTRGGAALSIRKMTNVPIKFIGMGEKLDALEIFHPERMASRILGMGDVMSLIEKATDSMDEEADMKMAEKMMAGNFDFNDFLQQMKMMKRMGGLGNIMKMLPGLGGNKMPEVDPKIMVRTESIVYSMTEKERRDPSLINQSRKERIARGAGVKLNDVNALVKQFTDMKKMMKQISGMSDGQMQMMANQMKRPGAPGMGMPGLGSNRAARRGKGKNRGGFKI